MAKKTKAEILTTIADMDASGEKISVRTVRDRLGGSMSHIAPIVKEYNSTRALDSAPEKVYSALAGVADQLWADASKIAKENWNSERLDLHSKLEDLESELKDALEENEDKDVTIIARDKQISELQATFATDKAELVQLVDSARRHADKTVEEANKTTQASETRNAKLEAQLEGAKEQIEMLKDMLKKFEPATTKTKA